MPLRGDLNSVDLAHVFQMLILNQKAGTLEIVHDGVKRRLFFTAEGVFVPCQADLLVRRAVRALVRANLLCAEKAERARCNMGVVGKDLLATLVEMKVLKPEERIQALRRQLEEEVYELFFLGDASFEFRDGDLPDEAGEMERELALSPNALIMEAARRIDEWEFIKTLVASGDHVVETRSDLSRLDARENDADARAVFDAIDGVRTVDEIIERTEISRFVVFRKIALLLDARVAAAVPVEDLLERARACLAAGTVRSAVNLFRRAIALGAGDVAVLAGAGQAHETLDECDKAAEHYLAAGRKAEAGGNLDAAVKLYMRIRQLLPTQVEARERLFALRKVAAAQFARAAYDPEAEGSDLARILFELGRSEELVLVLSGLLDLAADRPADIERVSDLSARLGQVAFAVDALLRASERRAAARDFQGAVRCVKKAQLLDPSRGDLAERLGRLGDAVRVRRQRRRSAARALAMALAFGAFFVGYGKYSSAALRAYSEFSLEDFLLTREFEQGREFYGGILRRFPLTIPFLLSFEKLRELEVAELHTAEVDRYRAEVEGEEEHDRLKQARVFKEAALGARHTGNYREAVDLLKKALALSGREDPFEVQEAIDSLEQYLAAASRLQSEATFFRNAGQFEEAHCRLRELIQDYPNAPEAADVRLPVRVSSSPAKARVFVDGQPVRIGMESSYVHAETPFVLDLPSKGDVEIALTRDGYVRAQSRVKAADQASLHFDLARCADLETILPFEVMQPAAFDGDIVVLALASGRVAALDAASFAVRWMRELPDLAEATAAPVLFGDRIAVPTTERKLLNLDRASGQTIGEVALPGRPAGRAAFSGAMVAIALEGGGLALGPALGGEALPLLTLPAPVSAGPVAIGGGRFAVGCEGGKVWICAPDRSLTALRNPGPAAGRVSALATQGDLLFYGDEAGALHVFRIQKAEHLASVAALDGRPVLEISADARLPVVGGGGRLAAVDLAAARVVATREGGLRLAEGGGSCVAAASADGTVLVLSRARLEEAARFSGDARITQQGVVQDGRGVFAAGTGKVIGLFCESRRESAADK
ncbi:MAG: DUF4388 domain-containing protein [Planctomycetes bacterium]|nr:DUF4388 domain-containing protein [Planctomycetota bacterium]